MQIVKVIKNISRASHLFNKTVEVIEDNTFINDGKKGGYIFCRFEGKEFVLLPLEFEFVENKHENNKS